MFFIKSEFSLSLSFKYASIFLDSSSTLKKTEIALQMIQIKQFWLLHYYDTTHVSLDSSYVRF